MADPQQVPEGQDPPPVPQTARLVLEVVAGIVPNSPIPEHTRRYVLTGQQWEAAVTAGTSGQVLAELVGQANGYATLLMLQPDRFNWVSTDWVWM